MRYKPKMVNAVPTPQTQACSYADALMTADLVIEADNDSYSAPLEYKLLGEWDRMMFKVTCEARRNAEKPGGEGTDYWQVSCGAILFELTRGGREHAIQWLRDSLASFPPNV